MHNLTFGTFVTSPPIALASPLFSLSIAIAKKMTLVEHRGYLAFPGAITLCSLLDEFLSS